MMMSDDSRVVERAGNGSGEARQLRLLRRDAKKDEEQPPRRATGSRVQLVGEVEAGTSSSDDRRQFDGSLVAQRMAAGGGSGDGGQVRGAGGNVVVAEAEHGCSLAVACGGRHG